MFNENEILQINALGISIETAKQQIKRFKIGFPPMQLISAATPKKGILVLSESETPRLVNVFENALSSGLDALKFVPASGAASRMFKNLFSFLDKATSKEKANQIAIDDDFMNVFFENIEKFAFYNELEKRVTDKDNKAEWVQMLLSDKGLAYGNKPKGQLLFHKYNSSSRTPFEEHLIEAASYCTGSNGKARVHFTVSPNHRNGFEQILTEVKTAYQKKLGVKFDIRFSYQKNSTDTIAVDMDNNPFVNDDKSLLFRPGGHGALIENLSELDADLIFIKNIDNVVPDRLKAETNHYKKALAGLLISYRDKIFKYIEKLNKPETREDTVLLNTIESFLRKQLCVDFENNFTTTEAEISFLKSKLNRPIRICGVVKNQGEPGGGPFICVNPDGTSSTQVVESAQIDTNNKEQVKIMQEATHFNPVDLICYTKNFKGEKFDLLKFRDDNTGFISSKSKDGRELKALELPGLWNGAMSDWNTIFVEVPISTFNPVKTINDLLRPEHQ